MSNAGFNAMLQADALNVFKGAADFGESITYKLQNNTEATYTTNVFRSPPQPIQDTAGQRTKNKFTAQLAVFIPYDPMGASGQAAIPIRGGDQIYTSEQVGWPPQWFPIVEIMFSDVAGWFVKLR